MLGISISLGVVWAFAFVAKVNRDHVAAEQVRSPIIHIVDQYGREEQPHKYCVNGVVYFGDPYVLLYGRDGKVVQCDWDKLGEKK